MKLFKPFSRNPALRAGLLLEQQLLDELGGLNEAHPAWRALRQIISEQRQIEIQAAFARDLTPDGLARNCGRASALMDLEAALDELWRRTHPA